MNARATTVVIPLYNGARWIAETLDSVGAQQSPPADVLVIDDGSTDGSGDIVGRYAFARLLRNPRKGANAARSFGLSLAATPLVAMLDQDDVWHPGHLAALEKLADAHPRASAFFGGAVHFHETAALNLGRPGDDSVDFDPWAQFPSVAISTPSQVLIRRETLNQRGGWAERFTGLADHHAWLRLSADAPLRASTSATMGYRQHTTSYSAALRSTDPHAFAARLLAASADVLPFRRKCQPQRAASEEQLLSLAETMANWLRTLDTPDAAARAAAARRADAALAGHSPEAVAALWRQLFYFLSRVPGGTSFWRRGLREYSTYTKSPRSCERLRSSLREHLLSRVRSAWKRASG